MEISPRYAQQASPTEYAIWTRKEIQPVASTIPTLSTSPPERVSLMDWTQPILLAPEIAFRAQSSAKLEPRYGKRSSPLLMVPVRWVIILERRTPPEKRIDY